MRELRLCAVTLLLASTLFLTIEGHADSDRSSVDTDGLVRLIYFLPSDRPFRSERVEALLELIKDAQHYFADEMQKLGFGRKTFNVQTDASGEPVFDIINGKFTEDYYYEPLTDYKVWEELVEHLNSNELQHVYFIAIDLSYENLNGGDSGGLGGVIFYPAKGDDGFGPPGKAKLRHRHLTQWEEALGGFALFPASGIAFGVKTGAVRQHWGATLHELGHAFALEHDFLNGPSANVVGGTGAQLSRCAAEWLSVSRFFNTKSTFHNEPGAIQLLSFQTYSQDQISLRFKITDPDELHQAQLLIPTIHEGTGWGAQRVFHCQLLTGKTSTFETVVRTAEIVDRITLQIIDMGGNITWATFSLQLDETVPLQNALDINSDGRVNMLDLTPFISRFGQHGEDPADVTENGVIDVVDVLLVAAHIPTLSQQAIEMFTEADVRQWLTHAKQLEVENEILKKGIIELERLLALLTATMVDISDPNLRVAIETALNVVPGTPIVSSEMETLIRLEAQNANISDLTGLEHATNLKSLWLDGEDVQGTWRNSNSVSNLSPLAGLTNLTELELRDNNISNLSPLAGLTNLTRLGLRDNNISDISPLTGLTNLTWLNLEFTSISNLPPLTGLTNLTDLLLFGNSISDLSPLAGLTNLATLTLTRNGLSDISALASLTSLTRLGLAQNNLSDISTLENLTNLATLGLAYNDISDLLPLEGLTNLTRLGLRSNNISDISPLAGLTNLARLDLRHNRLSDISALVANTGLGSGDELLVDSNPLGYSAINTHIPVLQSRGVTVESDNRAHPTLLKISGDNQTGTSFASLPQPFVVEAQDENGSALVGVSVTFAITGGDGTLSTTITRTDTNGRAQSTLTLGPNLGTNTVQVSAVGIAVPATFHAVSDAEAPPITADVNDDGSVNILDLVVIASEFGNQGQNLEADANGDGVVNVLDLIFVAGMFDSEAAAPSVQSQVPETLTAVEVQGWLTDTRALQLKDPIMKRGFLMLEQLLISLTPRETELLANYPNPFNPETWIPYRLAEDAFVTLTIYDTVGQVVRTLDVGHRIASAYESRSKAIYWDGKNGLGEQVASGVYFYTLTAGDFSATRRLVILK